MFYHPKSHVRADVCGGDLMFVKLRKIRSRMCEWYNAKARGVFNRGKRDVRQMEILGRNLRWTQARLYCQANDRHRQSLLEGLGLSEKSKTVNRSAVKPEVIGREEGEANLEGTEKTISGAWRQR